MESWGWNSGFWVISREAFSNFGNMTTSSDSSMYLSACVCTIGTHAPSRPACWIKEWALKFRRGFCKSACGHSWKNACYFFCPMVFCKMDSHFPLQFFFPCENMDRSFPRRSWAKPSKLAICSSCDFFPQTPLKKSQSKQVLSSQSYNQRLCKTFPHSLKVQIQANSAWSFQNISSNLFLYLWFFLFPLPFGQGGPVSWMSC